METLSVARSVLSKYVYPCATSLRGGEKTALARSSLVARSGTRSCAQPSATPASSRVLADIVWRYISRLSQCSHMFGGHSIPSFMAFVEYLNIAFAKEDVWPFAINRSHERDPLTKFRNSSPTNIQRWKSRPAQSYHSASLVLLLICMAKEA